MGAIHVGGGGKAPSRSLVRRESACPGRDGYSTFFPPVFLSLNLVYDIALGDSVRLEVFSRQGHWLRKVR